MTINDIPPYIVNRFKILPSKIEDDTLYVDFVKTLTERQIEEIKSIIKIDNIKTEKRISMHHFNNEIKILYPEVTHKGDDNETKPETVKREDKFKPDEPENKEIFKNNKNRNETIIAKTNENDDMLSANNPTVFTPDIEEEPITMVDFISSIPLETLEKEIRKRYLNRDMSGKLLISNDNKVQFQLDELKWPSGIFNIKIIYESEVDPSTLNTDQKGEDNND